MVSLDLQFESNHSKCPSCKQTNCLAYYCLQRWVCSFQRCSRWTLKTVVRIMWDKCWFRAVTRTPGIDPLDRAMCNAANHFGSKHYLCQVCVCLCVLRKLSFSYSHILKRLTPSLVSDANYATAETSVEAKVSFLPPITELGVDKNACTNYLKCPLVKERPYWVNATFNVPGNIPQVNAHTLCHIHCINEFPMRQFNNVKVTIKLLSPANGNNRLDRTIACGYTRIGLKWVISNMETTLTTQVNYNYSMRGYYLHLIQIHFQSNKWLLEQNKDIFCRSSIDVVWCDGTEARPYRLRFDFSGWTVWQSRWWRIYTTSAEGRLAKVAHSKLLR